MNGFTLYARRTIKALTPAFMCVAAFLILTPGFIHAAEKPTRSHVLPVVYDIDAAKDVCDSLPLDQAEGVWVFPDDNVVVLVRRLPEISMTALPEYEITVVATTDVRLHPGDVIGYMKASPKDGEYRATLFTRRKASILTGGEDCTATLNKDADRFILTGHSRRPSLRVTFNPSQLMPKLWRMVRFNAGLSVSPKDKESPKAGMIKLHPSYDHNGSSRRRTRYL